MKARAEGGVVDARLDVYGTSNLKLAGSSFLPESLRSALTLRYHRSLDLSQQPRNEHLLRRAHRRRESCAVDRSRSRYQGFLSVECGLYLSAYVQCRFVGLFDVNLIPFSLIFDQFDANNELFFADFCLEKELDRFEVHSELSSHAEAEGSRFNLRFALSFSAKSE